MLALATVATPLVLALWLAGIVEMGLRTALAWRASRALVRASHPCDDAVLSGALRLAAEAHGLRTAPPLRLSRQQPMFQPKHQPLPSPMRSWPAGLPGCWPTCRPSGPTWSPS